MRRRYVAHLNRQLRKIMGARPAFTSEDAVFREVRRVTGLGKNEMYLACQAAVDDLGVAESRRAA
jgi:hypothetical protein